MAPIKTKISVLSLAVGENHETRNFGTLLFQNYHNAKRKQPARLPDNFAEDVRLSTRRNRKKRCLSLS